MKKQNGLKRTLAGILAVLTVAGGLPANVSGFMTGSPALVASAEGAMPTEGDAATAGDLAIVADLVRGQVLTKGTTVVLRRSGDTDLELFNEETKHWDEYGYHAHDGIETGAGDETVTLDRDMIVVARWWHPEVDHLAIRLGDVPTGEITRYGQFMIPRGVGEFGTAVPAASTEEEIKNLLIANVSELKEMATNAGRAYITPVWYNKETEQYCLMDIKLADFNAEQIPSKTPWKTDLEQIMNSCVDYESNSSDLILIFDAPTPEITEPTISSPLTYNGQQQPLLTGGSVTEGQGTMSFAVGDAAPSNDADWSTDVPTAKDAGKYKIWYKVDAAEGFSDISATELGTAEIQQADLNIAAPEGKELYYTGELQPLLDAFTNLPKGVEAIYVMDGLAYPEIPTATDVGEYEIRVLIDGGHNYNDLAFEAVKSTINRAKVLFKVPNGAVIADKDGNAVALDNGTANLTVANTYVIYSNTTLTPDKNDGLDINSAADGYTIGANSYRYKYSVKIDSNVENGAEYSFSHIHSAYAFSSNEQHTRTDEVWVSCSGEEGVKESRVAYMPFSEEGTYYYGSVPKKEDIVLTNAFGATASVTDFYFTKDGDDSGLKYKPENMTVGERYIAHANVKVTIGSNDSNFALTSSFEYAARPLNMCDLYYLDASGNEKPVTLNEETETYDIDLAAYDSTEKNLTVIIKNPENGEVLGLGTEFNRLEASEDWDAAKKASFTDKATNAGTYWTGFAAPEKIGENDNRYTGSIKVNWSIAKATASIKGEQQENLIYDGAALEKSDFKFAANNALSQELVDGIKDGKTVVKLGTSIVNAGTYTAKLTLSSANFKNVTLNVPVTVLKRHVKLTPADDQSIVYGTASAPVIRYTAENAVDADNDSVWDTNTGLLPMDAALDFTPMLGIQDFDYKYFINNADTYNYTLTDYSMQNYVGDLDGSAVFTVEPKELTPDMFDIEEVEYIFNGTMQRRPGYTFSDGKFSDKKTPKLTSGDLDQGGTEYAIFPGTYTVEFTGQRNYKGFLSFEWDIDSISDYAVSVSIEGKTYDGTAVTPSSYIYKTGDKSKTPVSISGAQTTYTYYAYDGTSAINEKYIKSLTALDGAPKDAGTYILVANTTARGYSFDAVYATFTIAQKEVEVFPNAVSKVYGAADPDFTDFTFDEDALIEGETLTIDGGFGLDNYNGDAGFYKFNTGTLKPSSSNYSLTINGGFVVSKQEIGDVNIHQIKPCVTGDDGWAYPGDSIMVTATVNGETVELKPAVFDNDGNYISGDYDISFINRTKILGNYSVQILGVGNYTGIGEKIIEILSGDCQVNVTNGTLADGAVSAYFPKNTVVIATADPAADGYKFGYWKKNGVTVSYNPTYTFGVSAAKNDLEAVYLEDSDNVERYGQVGMEGVTIDKENSKLTFVSAMSVPDDCTIIKGGVLATCDASKLDALFVGIGSNDEKTTFEKVFTTEKHNYKYTWTKNSVAADQTWYVKGYLVYEDANGVQKTVYSDIAKATLEGYETIVEDKILGTAVVDDVISLTDVNKLRFVAMMSVPADCTISKAGIVATSDAEKAQNLTDENADFVRVNDKPVTAHNYQYTWTKTNVTADQTWYVKAYLVYTDANGIERTVYGDLTTGTLN